MQKLTAKQIIIAATIVIGIVLIIVFVRGCGDGKKREFEYEKVQKGEVNKTIAVTGVLEVLNSKVVLSKADGVVNKLYTDFNKTVKKGQLLATLDASLIDQKIMKIKML